MVKDFKSLGTSLDDLDQAWTDRLADSRTLFEAGRNASAIASGIYALEICLKVQICKKLDLLFLPKVFEIHDLEALLTMSGLLRKLNSSDSLEVKKNWDAIVFLSRSLNELRYHPDARWTKTEVERFLDQLESSSHGVLTWLSSQPGNTR